MDLTVVDAFTDRPFSGNPAAVAVCESFPAGQLMQEVAKEMNLSETAFVVRRSDGDHDLRWFTPTTEVDLCGHATLASAHVIGVSTRFHTRSGPLACSVSQEGMIEMDFPIDVPVAEPVPEGFGIEDVRWYGRGRDDVLIELGTAATVRTFTPDMAAMAALGSRGVIVTAVADVPGTDCVSRVFGPNVGIPEDPVTGSAHCTLAAFWGERTGKSRLTGEQASPRGGTVYMELHGERVTIGGRAVTVSHVRMDI